MTSAELQALGHRCYFCGGAEFEVEPGRPDCFACTGCGMVVDVDADVLQPAVQALSGCFCAFCDVPAEGNFAVHRDGFDEGPEVDLCDDCGSGDVPSLSTIWDRIARPKAS